jgi:hypothetical protein
MHFKSILRFVSEVCQHLFNGFDNLTPEFAYAGCFQPPENKGDDKPVLASFFINKVVNWGKRVLGIGGGGGGGGNKKQASPATPAAPQIKLPDPPPPTPPPAFPDSTDGYLETQEKLKNKNKGFGFKATLLNDGTRNTATGSGSLLGM